MGGRKTLHLALGIAACLFAHAGQPGAQKYGGVLNALLIGSPPSLSIHEEPTLFTNWPMMPAYSNLVLFDPLKAEESFETIVPELAERWEWSADHMRLTFVMRPGVTFHGGKPLTAADAKHTFDVVRGASRERPRTSPRKLWYANVAEIVTSGDRELTFKLKRPQPALLAMLASGNSPVYPAHVPFKDLRTKVVGTGPFVFKEYKADQHIVYERNPNYWLKGRPYLDGIRYSVITTLPGQIAALVSGQVEVDFPATTTKPMMEQLRRASSSLTYAPISRLAYSNVIVNVRRKPWDDLRLRQVLTLALDRDAMIRSVFQGGYQRGGVNLPPPNGTWGLPDERLRQLPGYGDAERNRQKAREIMRSLGYSGANRLRTTVVTAIPNIYMGPATFTVAALKDVFIEADLKTLEAAMWFGTMARRDYEIAVNSTSISIDDPDVSLTENFACDSLRNYSNYCNPDIEKAIEAQSRETNPVKRKQMVWDLETQLITDVARVIYGYRINYNAMWPHVRNLVPHPSQSNYGRMQETWLDK